MNYKDQCRFYMILNHTQHSQMELPALKVEIQLFVESHFGLPALNEQLQFMRPYISTAEFDKLSNDPRMEVAVSNVDVKRFLESSKLVDGGRQLRWYEAEPIIDNWIRLGPTRSFLPDDVDALGRFHLPFNQLDRELRSSAKRRDRRSRANAPVAEAHC